MIVWNSRLYIGSSIKKKQLRVMKKLEEGKFLKGIYCITLAENEENLFDIIDAMEFVYPHYKSISIHIVGIAGSSDEAEELLKTIVEDVYRETGELAIRKYFTSSGG